MEHIFLMRCRSYANTNTNIFRFERACGLYDDGSPILPWRDNGQCIVYKVFYVEDSKTCMSALVKYLKKHSTQLWYYTNATFEDSLENLLKMATKVLEPIKDVPKKSPLPMTQCEILSCICRFCNHQFKTVYNCERHMYNCKMQDDPIKILEIELNIDIPPPPKNTCAYCFNKFINRKLLNTHLKICSSKNVYQFMLEQRKLTQLIHQ